MTAIFGTMKFRVAIWYAALFIIAFAATFISVYYTLSSNMAKRLDKELLADSSELEAHYLPGADLADGEAWLPAGKVPAEISDAIAKTEFKLFKARRNGDGSYQGIGIKAGKAYELSMAASGALEKQAEIPLEARLRRIENEFNSEAHAEGVNNIFFLMLSPEREILAKSPLESWPGIEKIAKEDIPLKDGVCFRTIRVKNHRERIRVMDVRFPDGRIIAIGKGMKREDMVLRAYVSISSSVFAAMLLCGSVVGWFIAGKSMAGVERLGEAAKAIGQGDFSRRVPLRDSEGAELRELVSAFNEMTSRIQHLVQELKMMTDNIAHDMRTPLTRMKGILEVAMGSPGCSNGEWRETACNLAEEANNLIQMINTMLEITQTEGGITALAAESVDIGEAVLAAHRLFLPLAEEKHINFKLEIPGLPLFVTGDKLKLQRVISNLLDNAIKYSQEGGDVLISAELADPELRLSVKDSGPGIEPSEQELIFDRFYRCDNSRSMPGNGLGLSLVRAIVKAHRGRMEIESAPGKGSRFTVVLPC
ncbi:MAG: hypothetical protein A2X49_15035 [Lentisphaerae bacterium GWF2_52_8]|nr:MAG: hypothetical protein A2X49_15035 [Lentisphaerae bacterium GWF2_52_8]